MDKPNSYFYGQGRISLAPIDPTSGLPGKFVFVGDVSACTVKLTNSKVSHNESYSGQVAQTAYFPTKKSGTLDMTINQIDSNSLALALFGTTASTVAGTVTGETVPAGLVVGDTFYADNPQVSAVVITDSTAQPVTLVLGTHYEIDDANFGRFVLLSVNGITQPLKLAYSYGAFSQTAIFTQAQPVVALRYEGVNLADNNKPVMIDLYRVATDPLAQLQLISTGSDVEGMQVTGGLLIDTTKPSGGPLGQFGNLKQIALPVTP